MVHMRCPLDKLHSSIYMHVLLNIAGKTLNNQEFYQGLLVYVHLKEKTNLKFMMMSAMNMKSTHKSTNTRGSAVLYSAFFSLVSWSSFRFIRISVTVKQCKGWLGRT